MPEQSAQEVEPFTSHCVVAPWVGQNRNLTLDGISGHDDLSHTLQAHLDELRRDFAVSEIGIFGSFVRGEPREGSDVDMLVDFARAVGFFTFLKLENRLREILGKEVDLVTRKALKPHIGRRILNEVRYVHRERRPGLSGRYSAGDSRYP